MYIYIYIYREREREMYNNQTCDIGEQATSTAAGVGKGIHNVLQNRARTQVPLQAQKLHVHGSGTFGAFWDNLTWLGHRSPAKRTCRIFATCSAIARASNGTKGKGSPWPAHLLITTSCLYLGLIPLRPNLSSSISITI